jgi:hypothetical protein
MSDIDSVKHRHKLTLAKIWVDRHAGGQTERMIGWAGKQT